MLRTLWDLSREDTKIYIVSRQQHSRHPYMHTKRESEKKSTRTGEGRKRIICSERYATKFFFEEVAPKKFSIEYIDATTIALLKGLALTTMTPKPGFLSWYPYQIAVLSKIVR